MPKAVKEEVPVVIDGPGFSSRQLEWGSMTFAYEQCEGPLDPTTLFAALPTGRCECPHWGYVLEGSITFRYDDREEVVNAGELYYAKPGHVPLTNGRGKLIELSPTEELRRTIEGIQTAMAQESQ